MNDRPGGQEQQRLKEGMCKDVEHTGDIRPQTGGSNHETKLAHSRVGQHFFDVILSQRDTSSQQCGTSSDERHDGLSRWSQLKQYMSTGHHVQTGCHHGSSVNQCRNRGWACHRVGQPHI